MSQPPKTRSSSAATGTTSLILGERPSVRLPRRMVPICVSEPIGFEMPLRMARTPAIVVVLTAPRPTSSTPSFPRAGAISTGADTGQNYIRLRAARQGPRCGETSLTLRRDGRLGRPVSPKLARKTRERRRINYETMLSNPFTRGGDPHMLVVGMTGVQLGERFAQIGCAHGGRLGAVARKVGLSGRASAIVPDEPSAARARQGASDEGALVDVEIAPPTSLP